MLPQNLSADIQKRIKDAHDIDGYNSFISSMVSLNRNIPDVRSDVCKNKTYTNLPKASIVIPLHNEEWMLLMRTIHSIIRRSPPELIAEILLVDDASDRGELENSFLNSFEAILNTFRALAWQTRRFHQETPNRPNCPLAPKAWNYFEPNAWRCERSWTSHC